MDGEWTRATAAAIGDGPYPGHRPIGSWRLLADGTITRPGDVELSERTLVIAYGSNANPNKLVAHPELFADGDVVALAASVVGWAAVWCNGRRTHDGVVVATFVPVPGRTETHPLLVLSAAQLAVVDEWEGHPTRYRRTPHGGPVLLGNGQPAADVEVYLGVAATRLPLLLDGRPLLVAEVPYAEVDALVPA